MKLIVAFILFSVAVQTTLGFTVLDFILNSALIRFILNEVENPNNFFNFHKKNIDFNVEYYYLSREHSTKVQFDNTTLDLINPELPIKFIIPGWKQDTNEPYITDFSNAYLSIEDYNIIQVNWSGAGSRSYFEASYLSKKVGDVIGDLVVQINLQKLIPLYKFHLIGHSLGGQVAGLIGKRVQSLMNNMSIGRITALDPAGPYFTKVSNTERLIGNDAEMVDVTHTDGGYLGYKDPCGTIDFYINGGGPTQPGCAMKLIPTLLALLRGDPSSFFCNHQICNNYYNYSIRFDNLKATKCDSEKNYNHKKCSGNEKVIYGDKTPGWPQGTYYFNANGISPYKDV